MTYFLKHSARFSALAFLSLTCVGPVLASSQATGTALRSTEDERDHTAVTRPNALSGEVLGRAGLYSVNYDRSLGESFAVGAGLSTWSWSDFDYRGTVTILPAYGNYYFSPGPKRGFITAGIDLAILSADERTSSVYNSNRSSSLIRGSGVAPVAGGGYEFRGENGFLFRATGYVTLIQSTLIPWGGASFGVTF